MNSYIFRLLNLTAFCIFFNSSQSQTVLFGQDFETGPVTNILNNWGGETQLPEGPSPCGKGSRGNASVFNSANVNFNSAGNPGYFLGVNPQVPCGGFYYAILITDSLDFSGADSLTLSLKYYKTTTLNWGPAYFQVSLGNSTVNAVYNTEFSVVNAWDSVLFSVPAAIISNKVQLTIEMGGGEGVGVDDILILGYDSLTGKNSNNYRSGFRIFPNPVSDFFVVESGGDNSVISIQIVNQLGQVVYKTDEKGIVNISALKNGVYAVIISVSGKNPVVYKINKIN